MTLTERRAHWRASRKDVEPLARQHEFDSTEELHRCFTVSENAAEWLIEQLAERTVVALGGFEAAADAAAWLRAQASRDEEGTPEQLHIPDDRYVISADFGGIEYRMEVCSCLNEVTGRCHNAGCDRDTDWDSEPDGGRYPGYTKWWSHCGRCFGGRHANGGYSSEGTPTPTHRHNDADGPAYLRKFVDADEWVGWVCTEQVADDGTKCDYRWRFANAEEWASQYRLTRIWGDQVTGTQGYTLTQDEANEEAQRLNQLSAERNWGWTVGVEPITKENS